jgi:hypothetical protein
MVITSQRTAARDVPQGVLGHQRPHQCHVPGGETVECPTDGLGIGVLSHHSSSPWIHDLLRASRPRGQKSRQLPGQASASVAESAFVAAATCASEVAMAGAFSLRLLVVKPLAAVCNWANAVFTCCTSGWRTSDADACALSRFVFTLSIAVFNAVTPSCSGFTLVSASSEDFSAATSAHASVAAPDGEGELAAAVDDAAVAAGELASLGAELPPQLVKAHSRATAATALGANRRAERNRIWSSPPQDTVDHVTLHPDTAAGR